MLTLKRHINNTSADENNRCYGYLKNRCPSWGKKKKVGTMVRFYSCFISVWKLRRLSALYLKAKYFQIRAWYKISAAQHFLCHICYVLVLGMSGTVQNMVWQRLAKVCRAAYVAPKPTHIIKH